MDATHDPALTSWVSSAQGHPDFPIQNLPFGVFHRRRRQGRPVARARRHRHRGLRARPDRVPRRRLVHRGRGHSRRRPRGAVAQRAAGGRARDLARGPPTGERRARERFARLSRQPADRRPHPRPDGRGGAAAPRRRAATTPTSTPRCTTPPTSAACSGPTTRCCPTTSGCRSATMAAPPRSCRAGRRFGGRRAAQGRRRRRAGVRPDPRARLRGRVGSSSAPATRWARRCRSRGGGAHLRPVPGERLVRARRPELGVPAAGAVPGQELRDHDLALGRDAGGAGAVPRAGCPRPAGDPAPLPYLDSRRRTPRGGVRRHGRGLSAHGAHARAERVAPCG